MKTLTFFTLLVPAIAFGYSLNQPEGDSLYSFDADERLFTVHAFLNVAGYDKEFRKEGMDSIRIEVRDILKQRLSIQYRNELAAYYHRHDGGDYFSYGLLLLQPPDLSLRFDPITSDSAFAKAADFLPGLDSLIREFYSKADIRGLWKKYRPLIQAKENDFKPHAKKAIDELLAFFRTPAKDSPFSGRRIVSLVSPLLTHQFAFTATVNGDIYFVWGARDGMPSPASYYHEAGHHIVNPVVAKHLKELDKLRPLMPWLRGTIAGGYDSLEYIVDECFVRTVDQALEGREFAWTEAEVRRRVDDEYRLGFILAPYIYESLHAYGQTGKPFARYFPELIAGIDVGREEARWKKFWNLGPPRSVTVDVTARPLPDSDFVYITGSHPDLGAWDPGAVRLDRRAGNHWTKTFSLCEGTKLEFKITLGSWGKEALDDTGKVPGNSVLTVKGDTVITMSVKNWKAE